MSQTYGEKSQRAFLVYLSPVAFACLRIEGLPVREPGSPGLISLLATPPLMAIPVDTACCQLLLWPSGKEAGN